MQSSEVQQPTKGVLDPDEVYPSRKWLPHRGSHLPVLMKLLPMTMGPVVELGCGLYSTPFLHWACFHNKRSLLTYENNPAWLKFARLFENNYHKVIEVIDWDSINFYHPISVALVDHGPDRRRKQEVKKLVNADFVVIHDASNTHDRVYKLSTIRHLFKYRWKYNRVAPMTAVWSNRYDLTNFRVD
jgi:hypothetical protein